MMGSPVARYQSIGRCIEVVVAESDTRRDRWMFSQFVRWNDAKEDVLTMTLESFAHESRLSRRHTWRQNGPRFDRRDNRAYPHGGGVAGLSGIQIPESVVAAAKEFASSRIEVTVDKARAGLPWGA